MAFFSLTHHHFDKLQQEHTAASRKILELKDRPRTLLATILISNNFINIGIVIIADFVLENILPVDTFDSWAAGIIQILDLQADQAPAIKEIFNIVVTVIGVTFLLVLFGEVAPKVYARLNNLTLAKLMAGPMSFLMRLFGPFSAILVNWTKVIEARLAKRTQSGNLPTRAEIDEAIELTVSHELDNEQEMDILKSIVKFGEVSVKQIMRSRVDVLALDFREDYPHVLKIARDSGYSRIPVYDDDFDNITGILYVKDLIGHLNENPHFEWQQLIRTDVLFVPEAKKIDDLLREFQLQHMHMAIVVDEYGGTSGIVTLEDIMEEIIGEIKDEFDDEPELIFQKVDDFNYIFEGKTLLYDVCRVLGISTSTFDPVKGESDSFAGLILELLGELPQEGAEVSFDRYRFKVVSVNVRRIERIQIILPKVEGPVV